MAKKKGLVADVEILQQLPVVVDMILLKDRFSHFLNPVKKIFDLSRSGYLQRVQRGLYFNSKSSLLAITPHEGIANTLFYPSYVSLEWALQYYGLILDRVNVVTSVTTNRPAKFTLPLGVFTYEHVQKSRYPIGYLLEKQNPQAEFLIATPEKALVDYVDLRGQNLYLKKKYDFFDFLEEDLRLDLYAFLEQCRSENLKMLIPLYHRNSMERRLLLWLQAQKEEKYGTSN